MVSIIILSYNTKQYLHDCLSSVFARLSREDIEVIVVDNASKDKSVQMVKEKFPKVRIIQNEENYGFAKGNNIGAKSAKGDYLLFLNSDTQFETDSLSLLHQAASEKKDVGVVGGSLKNKDGTYQQAYGKFHTLPIIFATLFLGEDNEKVAKNLSEHGYVDWVTGAFMLVKKTLFEKVGGFDEKFFMYIEDMEFCYRLYRDGYRTYFVPETEILHVGQGSSNREFAIVNIYKGILYFYKKHRPYWQYMTVKLMLYTKAVILILLGTVVKNSYLRNTYRKALQF